jgi:hypothetical protein
VLVSRFKKAPTSLQCRLIRRDSGRTYTCESLFEFASCLVLVEVNRKQYHAGCTDLAPYLQQS